jgi:tetratricopeptide (TPR) repeat protein
LLALLKTEDVPAWRATLLELAAHYVEYEPGVVPAARAALTDADPLVRAAAVRALSGRPEAASWLRPALNDPVRLVRLDATWALPAEVAPRSPLETELRTYLDIAADQPLGQLRLGQYYANRGDFPTAEAAVRKAVQWEPLSAAPLENLALVQQSAGRLDAAADSFLQAGQLAPHDASLTLRAGLAYAQVGRLSEAERALRETIVRDPADHRTRYNLALLLAQADHLPEAVSLIQEAERLAPAAADYPYARATLHLRLGQPLAADAALARALAIDPNHPGARALATQRSRK